MTPRLEKGQEIDSSLTWCFGGSSGTDILRKFSVDEPSADSGLNLIPATILKTMGNAKKLMDMFRE